MGREGEEEGRAIRKVDRMWRTAESAFPVVQPDRGHFGGLAAWKVRSLFIFSSGMY